MNAEVCSVEWKFINMSEQEEDLILRMYRLVGDRYILSSFLSLPRSFAGTLPQKIDNKEYDNIPYMYYIVQVCEYLECRTKLARTKPTSIGGFLRGGYWMWEGVFVPGLVWVMRKWTYFEVVDLNWTHYLKHNALSVSPI
ncbi:unnamed protein product, partial [Brassica oleracea]